MMTDATHCPHCTGKITHRDDAERRDLTNRLRRIEGQVRGIAAMIENDAYCTDIMTQVSAVRAALDSLNRCLLERHVKTCVTDGIRAGDDSVVDELNELLKRITR